nr:hypothetical protein [Planctomycetota bacterium]
ELAQHVCWDHWIRASRAKLDVDAVMRALPVNGHVATAVMRRTATVRRRPARRVPWLVAAVAAVVIAAATLAVLAQRESTASDDATTLVASSGQVDGQDGTYTLGDDGRIALSTGDGTRLDLRGPARMRVVPGAGLTIALQGGALSVDAAARGAERELAVLTPMAEVRAVLACEFELDATDAGTRLEVAAGTVRMRSSIADWSDLAAGERATAPARLMLLAVEDGTADEEQPSGRPGDEPELTVRAEAPQRMACLRFHLPTARVRSAVLSLRRTRGEGQVDAYATLDAWDEVTLRWWHVPQRGRHLGTLIDDAQGREHVEVTSACDGLRCDVSLWAAAQVEASFASREAVAGAPALELTLHPLNHLEAP